MPEAAQHLVGARGKQVAVEGLRQAILQGEMSPGQRLVEAELVEQFDVTRTSVRAAMDELVLEGLVERFPNRGARVRVVSVDEAVAILECRGVLEGLIAARAATRATKSDVRDLQDMALAMQQAVSNVELMTYSGLNSRLHARIAEISEQETASQLIHRLKSQIVRHQFQLSLRPGRPQVSLGQHIEIIEAIVAHDPARADRAAKAHLDSVISALETGGSG